MTIAQLETLCPASACRAARRALPFWLFCAITVQPLRAQLAEHASSTTSRPAEPVTDFTTVQRSKIYRAIRIADPIVIDGIVDESAWGQAQVGRDFYQTDPQNGAPATEETEFRILYDADQVYVAVSAYQQDPIIISELKREFSATDGDLIVLFFDTFDDDRNGFAFSTNPGSAMRDQQISSGAVNENWDGIYEVAARVHDWGWSAEFAIPFKTLRFDDTKREQTWGFNIQRIMRHRNEWVQWSPAPRPFRIFEVSVAGTLLGIEDVRQGMNLNVKPFFVGNLQDGGPSLPGQKKLDSGVDIKFGVTSGLTLDLTVNTDFSQVEADDQQVNLTRFGLFFPEKREFFLENLGLFDVCGNAGGRGGGGGGGRCGGGREVVPFFSRRIGLSEAGQPLSIRGGARLTGKLAGLDVGFLGMNVGGEGGAPANNWMVARLRRDVHTNSQLGGFLFHRRADGGADWNRTVGLDGNLNFLQQRLNVSGFVMQAETPTTTGSNLATSVGVQYQDRLVNANSGLVWIAEDFRNDFGFTPRLGIRHYVNRLGITPRFSGIILEAAPSLTLRRTYDHSNRLLSEFSFFTTSVTFRDGSDLTFYRNWLFERLDDTFRIQGVTIPAGAYRFADWNVRFATSRARRVSASGGYRFGEFYNGSKKEITAGVGVRYSASFRAQVNWGRNVVDLGEEGFTTDLLNVRADAAFSPKVLLQALVQYNTAAETLSTNVRYRFIHHPLSDFFIVYNEVRPTVGDDETLRVVSVKVTHLLTF